MSNGPIDTWSGWRTIAGEEPPPGFHVEVVEMMSWWNHSSAWSYAVMSLGMIAFWAMLVWAFVDIRRTDSRSADRARSNEPPTTEAERIVAQLFARGEIDAGEYHRRLTDLQQPHHAGSNR